MPFTWSVVQPIPLNLAKLPHIIDEVAQEREEISHIELFHHNGHIDVIVSLENGKCILKHQDSHEKITQMLSTFEIKHLLIALAAFFLSFVCLFVCFVNFIFLSLSPASTLSKKKF